MYFNNQKSNTNIDNDFNNKSNILSSFLSIISKYKKIIIISIIILILLIIMVMIFSNRKVNKYLELTDEEIVTIYEGTDYVEPGYKAYNSKDEDLKSEVIIETNLNNKEIGEYEVLYTLGNITRIRKVNVIAKPKEYTYIHLNGVEKGTTDVYVKLGEKYEEPGYTVFSSTGTDLTNNVVVTGEVDTSKKGTYIKTYTVMDTSGVTISASRNVIVIDSNINLTLNTNSYTNKDIIINIEVIDEYFDYMILPDNTKVNVTKYTYKVTENGKYTFKTANKKGMTKESSIEVKNIDKIAPSGSCSATYKEGITTINVNAKDNVGISKHTINGNVHTSNLITVNGKLDIATLTIYDKAGNTNNISCEVKIIDLCPNGKERKRYNFVYYNQKDYNDPYSGNTIAKSGCGPTTMAMVLTYFVGCEITPPELAIWSREHGYEGGGTSQEFMSAVASSYGVICTDKKSNGKNYNVYDITYDNAGYPHFLIYKDNQWIRMSAKHFRPYNSEDLIKELNDLNKISIFAD